MTPMCPHAAARLDALEASVQELHAVLYAKARDYYDAGRFNIAGQIQQHAAEIFAACPGFHVERWP